MIRPGLHLTAFALALGAATAGAHSVRAQLADVSPGPNDYSDSAAWLCRPGRQDACTLDLTTTIVEADGSLTPRRWTADSQAPVDCFYVYPTVSGDATGNSDMVPGPGENGIVRSQLARFGSKCRLFAPLYRQTTLAALRSYFAGTPMKSDRDLGYSDVANAWRHYLEHDNQGRGVILIGHSQGTRMLVRLIGEEIDGKAVQDRIVSALLIGNNVAVPEGKDVGGSFQHLPLCRAAHQTGCVITYMTFRSTLPPEETFFARVEGEGMEAGCTNPGALAGGPAELDPYFGHLPATWDREGGSEFGGPPIAWTEPATAIETEFVSTPGLVAGECVRKNGYSYLEATVRADPDDPRTDDIPGDLILNGQVSAFWGLHMVDVGIAMGNLLEIVERQTEAFLKP